MSGTVHGTGSFCARCGAPRDGTLSCGGCGSRHADVPVAAVPVQAPAPYPEVRPAATTGSLQAGFQAGHTLLRKQVTPVGAGFGAGAAAGPLLAPDPPAAPATIGARVAARLVDTGVLLVVDAVALLGLLALTLAGVVPGAAGLALLLLLWGLSLPVVLVHRALCERSEAQATPGKWLLGLQIRRDDAQRVTAGTSAARFGAELLSGLAFLVGYLSALWHPERRTWHDTLTGTRVVQARRRGGTALAQITAAVAVGQLVVLLVTGAALGSLVGTGSGSTGDGSTGGTGQQAQSGGDASTGTTGGGTTGGSTVEEPGTEPTDPPVEDVWDGPVVELDPVSVRASAERKGVSLRCTGDWVSYDAEQLVDGDLGTGWGAGADDGTGESVTIRFAGPVRLQQVGLTPGYAKVGPRQDTGCTSVPAFPRNRFVPLVEYAFDDGTTTVQRFAYSDELQWVSVDTVTTSVVITILATEQPPGADDDTILSEAQFRGSTS